MKHPVFVKPTGAELKRAALLSLFTTLVCLAWPVAALAQQAAQSGSALNIDLGSGARLTQRAVQ
ncbi:MAG TPA: flagellar biosynthetic protein FliP, partial [Brevundimonas sp.]|nr:flagellar biosynthetic protein FliP [Brevundimonas sp.]